MSHARTQLHLLPVDDRPTIEKVYPVEPWPPPPAVTKAGPTAPRRVLIESPYAGKTPAETAENVEYARAAMRDCLDRGEAPFASHLLYTQVYDDTVPELRTRGIEAGLAWGEVAEVTVVYVDLGISKGMELGIKRAHDQSRPVEYRRLGKGGSAA